MIMLTFLLAHLCRVYGEKHEKNECATSHPFRGCFRKVATNRATLCVFVIFLGGGMFHTMNGVCFSMKWLLRGSETVTSQKLIFLS